MPTLPKNEQAPRSIFPDGIRTSGQHPPLYAALQPYQDFPKEITGPTVWKREDYINKPEAWVHIFTNEEIQELGEAADQFIERGAPLTAISKVHSSLHASTPPNLFSIQIKKRRAKLIQNKTGKLPPPQPLQNPHPPPQ